MRVCVCVCVGLGGGSLTSGNEYNSLPAPLHLERVMLVLCAPAVPSWAEHGAKPRQDFLETCAISESRLEILAERTAATPPLRQRKRGQLVLFLLFLSAPNFSTSAVGDCADHLGSRATTSSGRPGAGIGAGTRAPGLMRLATSPVSPLLFKTNQRSLLLPLPF